MPANSIRSDSVIASTAYFQTYDDSLGYAEFRELSGDEQLALREKARQWIGYSKDAVARSRGLGVSRGAHSITMGEQRASLVQAFNAAATAVGYCPYMAEAWLQYAEVAAFGDPLPLGAPTLGFHSKAAMLGFRLRHLMQPLPAAAGKIAARLFQQVG